jgi:hypothetical protein
MGFVAYEGWSKGDPLRLVNGYDYKGNICGHGNFSEFDRVFYPFPFDLTYAVCVKDCPKGFDWNQECFEESEVDQVVHQREYTQLKRSPCYMTYAAVAVHTRCFPDLSVVLPSNMTTFVPEDFKNFYSSTTSSASRLMGELVDNKWVIASSLGVALGVGLIYLVLLRLFIGVIVWATVIIVEALLIVTAFLLFYKVRIIHPDDLPGEINSVVNSVDWYDSSAKTEQDILFWIAVAVGVFATICFLFLCCMFPRINFAIKVMRGASKAFGAMPYLMILPVFVYFFLLLLHAFCIAVAMYVASIGEDFDAEKGVYTLAEENKYMLVYLMFGFLWTRAFFIAVGDMISAGAVGRWYYTHDKKGVQWYLTGAMKTTLRYHLGSAAFGALIIAVVQMIRIIFNYVVSKMKELDENMVAKFVIALINCCLHCIERFLEFINKNAYIQVAIWGHSFCKGAREAFTLLLSNAFRVIAVQSVSGAFIFMGKLFIALVTSFIAALMLVKANWNNVAEKWSEVTSAPPFTIGVIFVLSYLVASAFMNVFEMCIDTIFQCYCEDAERSEYADEELQSFMKSHEKPRELVETGHA